MTGRDGATHTGQRRVCTDGLTALARGAEEVCRLTPTTRRALADAQATQTVRRRRHCGHVTTTHRRRRCRRSPWLGPSCRHHTRARTHVINHG
eukprot:COSAG01_NODE_1628_length_9684_cov_9.777673_3_plen_93_part_00